MDGEDFELEGFNNFELFSQSSVKKDEYSLLGKTVAAVVGTEVR